MIRSLAHLHHLIFVNVVAVNLLLFFAARFATTLVAITNQAGHKFTETALIRLAYVNVVAGNALR